MAIMFLSLEKCDHNEEDCFFKPVNFFGLSRVIWWLSAEVGLVVVCHLDKVKGSVSTKQT